MVPDWIIAALNLLRPGLRLYLAITLAAGLFLFLPEGLLTFLGVQELVAEHRAYLGISFITIGCLSAIYLVGYAWPVCSEPAGAWWSRTRAARAYRTLSPSEKTVLAWSTERHRDSFKAPIYTRTIQSLVDKGILESLSTQGDYGTYLIDPTMWSALNSVRDEVRRALRNDEADVQQILKILAETQNKRFY